MTKDIQVVFYSYRLVSEEWRPPSLSQDPREFVTQLAKEYGKYGIVIGCREEPENVLDVKGYADLLNTVRLRTDDGSLGNPCLGHVIGQSANCDLLEDIRRGLSRLAFAPETIEPDASGKRVCHNCGCGC